MNTYKLGTVKKLSTAFFLVVFLSNGFICSVSAQNGFSSALVTGSGSDVESALPAGLNENVNTTTPEVTTSANTPKPTVTESNADEAAMKYQKEQEAIMRAWGAKVNTAEQSVSQDRSQLIEKTLEAEQLQRRIDEYNNRISLLKEDIVSLDTETKLIQEALALTNMKIRNAEIQIEEKKQDIVQTYQKVAIAEVALQNQEQIVAKYIELLYKQNSLYFSHKNQLENDISLFLTDGGVSKVLLQKRYMERLREAGSDVIGDLSNVQELLAIRNRQLADDQGRLEDLNNRLQIEKVSYEQQHESKQVLLVNTKGEEATFQKMVQESIEEQKKVSEEILSMQASIGDVESRIRLFSLNIKNGSLTDAELKERLRILEELGDSGKIGLDWPVPPLRGISAHYQDPSYTARFGVPHSAIDIPTPQNTPIQAPADGYVSKVRDNGYGYSYIVLVHNGKIMTLYGHVTKILVNAGDLVHRGDVIGLSGATPGTLGAGWMTTGPHLHFEVFQNGKHVNPMLFMDMSQMKKE